MCIKGWSKNQRFTVFHGVYVKDEEEKLILFKDTSEFKDSPHMWCEIGESIIGVQPFVDGYNDAILLTNEEEYSVSNQNFYELSGLTHDVVINKSIFDLEKKNILPYCAIMDVIKPINLRIPSLRFQMEKEVMMSVILSLTMMGT